MLTVYIDFKSPDAYLALAPTLALAEQYALEIDWRPFRTIERDVPKLGEDETVGESHRRVRAESQRRIAIKYAAHQGIDLEFPKHLGDTDLALAILTQVDDDPTAFIHGAFHAYWHAHVDLNDMAVVHALLQESGVLYTGSLATAREDLETAQDRAEADGIVGAPAYVIAEQIFVGREHLPWIEDIIRDHQSA